MALVQLALPNSYPRTLLLSRLITAKIAVLTYLSLVLINIAIDHIYLDINSSESVSQF